MFSPYSNTLKAFEDHEVTNVRSEERMTRGPHIAGHQSYTKGCKSATKRPRNRKNRLTRRPIHLSRVPGDMPALLAGDAPRSENDPDLKAASVAAAASIAMHPVTGAFADPAHESAFAAQFFRLAFRCHAFLMALMLVVTAWSAFRAPFLWTLSRSTLAICIIGLAGRVMVHRIEDTERGQRMGSSTWTALAVLAMVSDVSDYLAVPAATCRTAAIQDLSTMAMHPLVALAFALVNGTHGLSFSRRIGLTVLLMVIFFCDCQLQAGMFQVLSAVLALIGFAVAHLAEMHLRHSYAEKQGLRRRSKDEAEDIQRLERERRRLEESMDGESRRLEERNEQLRAEKARLVRGLQAGPNQPGDGSSRVPPPPAGP